MLRAAISSGTDERGPNRWFVGGLLGAVAANLAANLFAFDSVATGALFWMPAGLPVAPRSRRRQKSAPARAANRTQALSSDATVG